MWRTSMCFAGNDKMKNQSAIRELIISAMQDACLPYLAKVLARLPDDRHSHIQGLFETHMAFLADYCLAGYGGRGSLTAAFICGLHKALFPENYRQILMTTPEGEVYMVPGEYKRFPNGGDSNLYPNQYNVCIAPEDVSESMAKVVNILNTALLSAADKQQKRDAILCFVVDFLMIHPFDDANGRVAYMLADVLAIMESLPPFSFHHIKSKDLLALYGAIESTRVAGVLAPLYEVIERYNPAALA